MLLLTITHLHEWGRIENVIRNWFLNHDDTTDMQIKKFIISPINIAVMQRGPDARTRVSRDSQPIYIASIYSWKK